MSESEQPPTSHGFQDDLELKNPNISFREKWNRHVNEKKNKGILRHAPLMNRWMPRVFYFCCLGGTGWIVKGTIPFYYVHTPVWMLGMEVFTFFIFVQVMVNYYFTKSADSSYDPGVSDGQPVENETTSAPLPNPQTLLSDDSSQIAPGKTENPSSTAATYRILVATAVTGNDIERKQFSYWSWVPCLSCNRSRPPRCHHCTLCGQCVLKRDHHCYFTAICIGVNNHRYYMYFLFWCVLLTWHGCFQLVPYLFTEVLVHYSYWYLFVPFSLFRAVTGGLPFLHLHLIMVVWGVVFLAFVSFSMFANSSYLMLRGLTSFESSHGIKVVDTRNYCGRLRSVLGRNWGFDLLMPGRLVVSWLPDYLKPTDPLEDAVEWPHIKTA